MKTKTCTKCNESKPMKEFYKDKRVALGHRPECKVCFKLYSNTRYMNDPEYRERRRKQSNDYTRQRRKEFGIKLLRILKSTGCKDCGETDPIVLDFDHVRDKTDGISHMVRCNASWDDIVAEVAKCEVRCSNCHRRKTAKERNWYQDIDLDTI